ncbi:MAG: helix-turn-helix transcriptional regulator [Desulfobacula sp.]|nr:helix-turn-helix transcriptional regulator [Desulfobacula sp.]MBT7259801.1 helix-turn-helix transcriptional regulator [Desulfobacula sp.]
MENLKSLIPFDMALWASGHEKELEVHNTYLYNLPEILMESWEQIKHQDKLLAGLIANPGKTFDVYDFYSRYERKNLDTYQQHSKLFGIEHAISTAVSNPNSGLLEIMSLYRRDPEKKFSRDEQMVKQFIFPLMIAAWHSNQIQHLVNLPRPSVTDSLALCDIKAWIRHADPDFIGLIKGQWPKWSGPVLPKPIAAWLAGKEKKILKKKIVFSRRKINDLILVQAHPRGSIVFLTKREEQVAGSFAAGLTYKEIANELELSPNTIRSHIESIYKKLAVSNKVELLQAINPY